MGPAGASPPSTRMRVFTAPWGNSPQGLERFAPQRRRAGAIRTTGMERFVSPSGGVLRMARSRRSGRTRAWEHEDNGLFCDFLPDARAPRAHAPPIRPTRMARKRTRPKGVGCEPCAKAFTNSSDSFFSRLVALTLTRAGRENPCRRAMFPTGMLGPSLARPAAEPHRSRASNAPWKPSNASGMRCRTAPRRSGSGCPGA